MNLSQAGGLSQAMVLVPLETVEKCGMINSQGVPCCLVLNDFRTFLDNYFSYQTMMESQHCIVVSRI